MELTLTIEILKELSRKDVTLDDYILLNIITYQEEAFINEYLNLSNRNVLTLQSLFRKGYITVDPENDKLYTVTTKGESLINELQ
jgi:predicted transcriptional regulator